MDASELKSQIGHGDYYNRYRKDKKWSYIGLIAGRAIQSAEANEVQNIIEDKIKALGNAIYSEGAVISGCDISLNTELKVARLEPGRVFLDGLVYEVEAAELNIPGAEEVKIGIWLKRRTITELEDATLLCPAKNMPMYRMPGGYRVVISAEWGLDLDNLSAPFYPIYVISGGEIVRQANTEKNLDYLDALARYDRDSHGHYIVEGLTVTALANADSADNGKKQTYSISEGLAHIRGYEVKLSHAVRLVVSEEADLYEVTSEAHQYESNGASATIPVHQTPIEDVRSVRVTKERTVELTHGTYTGSSDALPDTSVIKLVEVKQGGTTFAQGADFRLDANKVNWELEGTEPAPGSRYTVTYHYRTNVAPDETTSTGIVLSGLVEGSLVELDYTYRMPRKDLIVMYRDNSITMIKGIPHRYAPVFPDTPPDAICLAEVTQTWVGLPEVRNVAVRAVKMSTLQKMLSSIQDLYNLSGRQEMRVDAMLSAPTSAFGVFVDPLFDGDMRDKGTPQTAMIADEMLQLPMETELHNIPTGGELTMEYDPVVLIDQPMHTKAMRINPYMVFDPMPALVTLAPASDRWTDTLRYSLQSTKNQTTTSFSEDAGGTLRQIDVRISASGFGYGEPVRVVFDGIEVQCATTQADETGKFEGTFRIPGGVPTGKKIVKLVGTHTTGAATFVGIRDVRTIINYYTPARVDPLGQSFVLDENWHGVGMDFYLSKKGVSPIQVEIREMQLGLPTTNVVASARIEPEKLKEGEFNRIFFDTPAFLSADTAYALVLLCDTADHEVGIVELGDWDPESGWARFQRYSPGVLFSSANASTWTPHQAADLAFRFLGAKFREGTRRVELAALDLTGVTDLAALAEVERTGATTDVTFVLEKEGAEVVRLQAWQALAFPAPLEGEHKLYADIFGSERFSPILGRDPQLLSGKIGTTGSYVSRAFVCGNGKKVMVTLEEFIPSGASLEVSVMTGPDTWSVASMNDEDPIGDGWYRRRYFVPCSHATTKIKLMLSGGAAARPKVRKISGVVLSA